MQQPVAVHATGGQLASVRVEWELTVEGDAGRTVDERSRLALAAQRSTQPLPRRSGADGTPGGSAIRSSALRIIILIMIGLGGVFGSVEVIVVAFAEEHGRKGAAGYVLASWALGSLISGVLYGAVHWQASLGRRLLIACPVFALSIVPLPFVPTLPVLAAVVFVAGFTISPTLIAAFGLVEARVPAAQLTEGLTWSTTGIGLGITVASAVAGQVIDDHGASDAFFVAVASGICAAAVALLAARPLTRAGQKPAHENDDAGTQDA